MTVQSLSLAVPVPCTIGYYGNHLVTFQTQVKPTALINLLGHDPRSKNWKNLSADVRKFYEYLQRKTTKIRYEATARYIEERISYGAYVLGAFPAISLGVVRPVKFEDYSRKYANTGIQAGVGEILFDLSAANSRILLDGLARVTGALNLIDDGKAEIADTFCFPVTIFAPHENLREVSLRELGQLFHDFNFLQSPVSVGQAIDLDQSNIFITLTNEVGKSPVIVNHGGMESRSRTLGSNSTALATKQVLLRFVAGACEGVGFQHTLRDINNAPKNLTRETFSHLKNRIERFLTEIASRMGSERFRDRESIHLSTPGWNALGIIFHNLEFRLRDKLTPADEDDIFDRIANINWSRWNSDWIGLLGDAAVDSEGKIINNSSGLQRLGKLYGGQQAITKLVDYISRHSGIPAHPPTMKQVDSENANTSAAVML